MTLELESVEGSRAFAGGKREEEAPESLTEELCKQCHIERVRY